MVVNSNQDSKYFSSISTNHPILSSEQVSQRLGIHYRTLMRLVEKGLLHPLKKDERSKAGYLWKEEDLPLVRVTGVLWSYGFNQTQIDKIHKIYMESMSVVSQSEIFLLVDKHDICAIRVLTKSDLLDIPALLRKGSLILPL